MNDLQIPHLLSISYHQLTVYPENSAPPILDWTDEAIKQGFAVAEDGVSFEGVRNGKAVIVVMLNGQKPVQTANRIVSVPFTNTKQHIHITSVMSQILTFPIPKGNYELTCSTLLQDEQDMYLLHFKNI
ncbi:competence protein ComJ [Bacillus sp. NPDC077027]|uniref:competence protein ComJ n=1 Tax=Bacillus sp. NPDC077027 TaxID=3390548 RepID=UPI003D08829A